MRLLDEKISMSKSKDLLPDSMPRATDEARIVSFLNPYSYTKLAESGLPLGNIEFAVDGTLLVVLHNVFHRDQVSRISFDFTSIAGAVLDTCQEKGLLIGIIGGKPGEVERAVGHISETWSELKIVYSRHGYYEDNELPSLLEELADLNLDVLICGMGTPRQEQFLIECKEYGVFKWAYTCGGFISQTAEREQYYPLVFRKYGMRWLYRFYRHGYVRRRVLIDYPKFLIKYVYRSVFLRKRPAAGSTAG
jgi:N-acetylglucosaminyldiphosphoundecaprenol N-acetyl-beta-D-mannosaminyltransferase